MNMSVAQWLKDNLLLLATIFGVAVGVALGLSLRPLELGPDAQLLLGYPGELFMRLLQLLILPLVIASLITGSASLNARLNGKIAARTIIYFLVTSLFNAIFGVILAVTLHPGDPATRDDLRRAAAPKKVNILDSFLDLGRNMVPDNMFQALFQQAETIYVEPKSSVFGVDVNATKIDPEDLVRAVAYRSGTNTLGIIVICLVFGTVLASVGKRARVVVEFFVVIDEVAMRVVKGMMWLTPVGVGSVICGKILAVADLAQVTRQLGWFIFAVVLGVFFYQLVVLQLIYWVFVRRNPFRFYVGLLQGWITAFATASTAAALPVTYRCMDEKVKVDPRITRFVLPIGATVNMDGTALYVSIASIFIAQMNEIPLGIGELVTVCVTATATSVASASVPSAAIMLMVIVLTAINVPAKDVSLLLAVDWFLDRIRTTNNMLGDCYAAAVVERLSMKELQKGRRASVASSIFAEWEREREFEVADALLNRSKVDSQSNGLSHLGDSQVPTPPEVVVVESDKEGK